MNDNLAGFCGDYCGKCPNSPSSCAGCVPESHRDCRFVRCCTARGLEHCGSCGELPCRDLADFVPDDRPECPPGYHIANLRRRQAVGTPQWLDEQRKKWGPAPAGPGERT
jgi:hypothetical protein